MLSNYYRAETKARSLGTCCSSLESCSLRELYVSVAEKGELHSPHVTISEHNSRNKKVSNDGDN